MADNDDPAEAAARLEEALERIAQLAGRAPVTPDSGIPVLSVADTVRVAARLDALIAQIRAALAAAASS